MLQCLRGGVNAPGVLSEEIHHYQQKVLLIHFQHPPDGTLPTDIETELAVLRRAAGAFRGAAEKARLGVLKDS